MTPKQKLRDNIYERTLQVLSAASGIEVIELEYKKEIEIIRPAEVIEVTEQILSDALTILDEIQGECDERESAIMQEAFMTGRIYSSLGEKESPHEIQRKLKENCEKAIKRNQGGSK